MLRVLWKWQLSSQRRCNRSNSYKYVPMSISMQTIEIQLKRLDVQQYDPKTNIATLKVGFYVGGVVRSITSKTTLNDVELVSTDILNALKQHAKQELKSPAGKVLYPEEIISSYALVMFGDEEATQEKLVAALAKLCSKCALLRHTRQHQDYMKLYDDVKTFFVVF